jgi:hypothetical protein
MSNSTRPEDEDNVQPGTSSSFVHLPDNGEGGATPEQAALFYISLGWPVLPLHTPLPILLASGPDAGETVYECDCSGNLKGKGRCTPGKHPRSDLVPHGVADATLDVALATRWWTKYPHANVGVDLWRAGLIDIAPDNVEWHAEFIARGLPPTFTFASGGGDGHVHYLYRRDRSDRRAVRNVNREGEYDILVRGYAVFPPSMHPIGRRYRWLTGIGVRGKLVRRD